MTSLAIAESEIQELVRRFYAKVRRDPEIGPIFNKAVADWDLHLEKLTDFWSSVMLDGRYKGNPMVAHLRLKAIRPADFQIWLGLFRETVDEFFPVESANAFKVRAENIARSLQLGMFYRPAGASNARSGAPSAQKIQS